MPKLCEKCGTYDPRPDLTAIARCPACGVIYAKVAEHPASAVTLPAADSRSATIPKGNLQISWPRLNAAEVWTSVALAGLLFAAVLFDDDGFVLLLDGANLAFHEAGHLFFGFLGSAMGLYGGTLGQLVFPGAAIASFWRRRHAVGVALSGVWLFENLLNIARYMADARAQLLPLVGGGEHDWYHIFSRWGVLNQDTEIAAVTGAIGWLGMLGCIAWLLRRWHIELRTAG